MGPIEARLKQIISEVCAEHQAEIEELEVMPDHVHLLVKVDPQFGIHRLTKLLKGRSSRLLRQEVLVLKRKLPSLWTNRYFVSTTGGVPLAIVKQQGLIVVEALVVRNMVKNSKLAKSIADASWSLFFTHLQAKAEEAGRTLVRVKPAFTSQRCSACGKIQQMPLSVRIYECPQCGLIMDRDHNGSINILADGLKAVGRDICVIPEAPGAGAVGSRHILKNVTKTWQVLLSVLLLRRMSSLDEKSSS